MDLAPTESYIIQYRYQDDPKWYFYGEHPTRLAALNEVTRMEGRASWLGCEVRIVEQISTYVVIDERIF
jgi:hypothetical protein